MAVVKLDVSKGKGIFWPKKCAVCGAEATSEGKAACSVVVKPRYRLIYFGWTKRRIKMTYPLCTKHRLVAFFPSLVSERNLFNLGVGFLAVFLFVFGVLFPIASYLIYREPILNPEFVIWYSFLFVLGVVACIGIQRLAPVKIKDANETMINLKFADQAYANEFAILNRASIVDTNKTSKNGT
jgi:hypothetical protein